jgi:hypothetical protein
MAYATTVTSLNVVLSGRPAVVVTIVETGVTGSTNEWSAEVPMMGTLHLHKCTLSPGTGTASTIDPIVQEATGTASVDCVFANGVAALTTRNDAIRAHYHVGTGLLYGRSAANGTTTGAGNITTVMIIQGSLD